MLDKLVKADPVKLLMTVNESIAEFERRIAFLDTIINNIDSVLRGSLEKQKTEERTVESEAEDDDFIGHLMKGMREIELAKAKVSCPVVQNIIDEILLFAEEKMEEIKWSNKEMVQTIEDVLREEGVEDWESLSEHEKTLIKEKIKSRLGMG